MKRALFLTLVLVVTVVSGASAAVDNITLSCPGGGAWANFETGPGGASSTFVGHRYSDGSKVVVKTILPFCNQPICPRYDSIYDPDVLWKTHVASGTSLGLHTGGCN